MNYTDMPDLNQLKENPNIYNALLQQLLYFSVLSNEASLQDRQFYLEQIIETIDFGDKVYDHDLKKSNLMHGNQIYQTIKDANKIIERGLPISYDLFQITGEDKWREKYFYYAQKLKGQQLWLTLLKSDAELFGKLPKELLLKEQDLLTEIAWQENKVYDYQREEKLDLAEEVKHGGLFSAQSNYAEFMKNLEQDYPIYFENKYNLRFETQKSFSDILEISDLTIEYSFVDTTSILISIIDKKNPIKIIEVERRSELSNIVQNYYSLLKNSTMSRPTTRKKFINLSHQLYQQFLQPIENQLIGLVIFLE